MADYIDVATFVDAGEVPMGDPVQTFRREIMAASTPLLVFTHPGGVRTIRVEMTPDVDIHYAIGVSPTADATVDHNGTRKATAGVTFYLWATAGQRLAVRTAQL